MNEAYLSHAISHALYKAKGGLYVNREPQLAGQDLHAVSAVDADIFMECFQQAEQIIQNQTGDTRPEGE